MRIKSVRLAWFRGAAAPIALEPASKSIVVYGENGSGKSSFVDAIEYAIRDGKIAHLSHEYSGRNQEKAIPNTHLPVGDNTEFWVNFPIDDSLNVQIGRRGTHSTSGGEVANMESWDYRRTVLRQDEVADFIRDTKGEKYSTLLPLLGLQGLEVGAENLRQLNRVIDSASKLGEKQGILQQSLGKRKEVFSELSDDEIQANIISMHRNYCPDKSASVETLACCADLKTALKARIAQFSISQARHLTLRSVATTKLHSAAKSVRDADSELAGLIEPLILEKLEVLQATEIFVSKLDTKGDLECPACGQSIPISKFEDHLLAEKARLKELSRIVEKRKAAIAELIDDLKAIKANLANDAVKSWLEEEILGPLKSHIEWIQALDAETLRSALDGPALESIEQYPQPIIARASECSADAPTEVLELSNAVVLVDAAKVVFDADVLSRDIDSLNALKAFLNRLESGVRQEIRDRSEAIIDEISADIGAMWQALHPGEPIEDVRLYLPENDKAIDIALKFYGKELDSPRLTLSEGYRNSLGLCIFLAMARRDGGTDRPIFLDDVVISLDRNHRGMVAQLLEDYFRERQVILFTHDRDWFAELRQQLPENRWSFKSLLPYDSPTVGIRWSHSTSTFDDARAHLETRPDSAGNDARKIMDVELSIVAEKLQISLPYLRGDKNDRRTAHDFIDRLKGDGRACFQLNTPTGFKCHEDAILLLDTAGRLLASWANRASHSFDVVRPEAVKLIDACEQALKGLRCQVCGKPVWFANAENQEWVQCQCGQVRWRYGKAPGLVAQS
jgi:RecF/RecN/SMC N terminal domain